MSQIPDLSGQIALVTGASRGIGYEIARQMAAAGAHVIAVARTVGGLEELDDKIKSDGGNATLVPLDLTDMEGIDRLGGVIAERWGKLDILVANAGILGSLTPVGQIKAKDFDRVIATNITGTWRLIRSVDPLLHQAEQGRALVISSSVAHKVKPYWGSYAASKSAIDMLVRVWAAENAKSNLRINLVNPGPTRTRMRAQAMPGEDPDSLPQPAETAAKIVALADLSVKESGAIYDVPLGAWVSPPPLMAP